METRWKIKDIPRGIAWTIKSIHEGKLLMRMDIGRYFVHILYCFVLIGLTIYLSLQIDNSLRTVEENRKTIENQEYILKLRNYELEAAQSRRAVLSTLEGMGSKVKPSEKPFIVK